MEELVTITIVTIAMVTYTRISIEKKKNKIKQKNRLDLIKKSVRKTLLETFFMTNVINSKPKC